jgi:homoisocitrate dehydrogenase
MKLLKIALIPGDGIGKEVIPAARKVLEKVIASEYLHLDAGFEHFQKTGDALPKETVASLKGCDGALFGAVGSPSHKVAGYSSPIVKLRKEMDLYANVRPVESAKGALGKPINMLIIRENTECLYIKDETLVEENGLKVAWAKRKISQYASERIAKMAFKMARQRDALRRYIYLYQY